jgi:hypothetical protein
LNIVFIQDFADLQTNLFLLDRVAQQDTNVSKIKRIRLREVFHAEANLSANRDPMSGPCIAGCRTLHFHDKYESIKVVEKRWNNSFIC